MLHHVDIADPQCFLRLSSDSSSIQARTLTQEIAEASGSVAKNVVDDVKNELNPHIEFLNVHSEETWADLWESHVAAMQREYNTMSEGPAKELQLDQILRHTDALKKLPQYPRGLEVHQKRERLRVFAELAATLAPINDVKALKQYLRGKRKK